jgi:hypothetical protein
MRELLIEIRYYLPIFADPTGRSFLGEDTNIFSIQAAPINKCSEEQKAEYKNRQITR